MTIAVARFKIFWTVAGMSIASVMFMVLFANSDSPAFQNDTINSIKTELSQNVENGLREAYNSTLREFGASIPNVLDPCNMAESFEDIQGMSKCGNFNNTDD